MTGASLLRQVVKGLFQANFLVGMCPQSDYKDFFLATCHHLGSWHFAIISYKQRIVSISYTAEESNFVIPQGAGVLHVQRFSIFCATHGELAYCAPHKQTREELAQYYDNTVLRMYSSLTMIPWRCAFLGCVNDRRNFWPSDRLV